MSYHQFTDDQGNGYGSCEIFYVTKQEALLNRKELWEEYKRPLNESMELSECYACFPGWYWQACFPGCLPDGSAMGPFKTEQEAMQDAGVAE